MKLYILTNLKKRKMKVETKKQVENINNSNEKLLLSDVNNSFCNLYKKKCMGGLCSVTPFPEKCKYLKQGGDVIESTTGYSCPNCGTICSDKTLISRTDSKFEEDPNPHYSWDETHKCQKCETLYLLHNGT